MLERIITFNFGDKDKDIVSDDPGDRNYFWREILKIREGSSDCVDAQLSEPV